jgi:hypothetical protein
LLDERVDFENQPTRSALNKKLVKILKPADDVDFEDEQECPEGV